MVNFLWDNLFRREGRKRDPATILKDNFLFQDLSARELRFVREVVHMRTFRAGEAVFRQGEVGIGMYIVVAGNVEILVEDSQSDGGEISSVFVTRLLPGDFFGEISLVEDNGRRTATAAAGVDTTLLGFFKPDLVEIVDRNPITGSKILLRLSQVLGKRLKETTEKVSELKREIKILTGGSL